jgi:5-(carboxyamino)imidazole ribonucleotide synthase
MSLELLPGSVIGILGDRSSSHYLIQTAHNLGYTVATYTDKTELITPSEADYQFHGADEWATFVGISSVITYANTWLTLPMIMPFQEPS